MFASSQPLELPLLKHAQEFQLHLSGHFADLVEEYGTAVSELEAADSSSRSRP